jgi:hypothetical protein
MVSRRTINHSIRKLQGVLAVLVVSILCMASVAWAQDRDWDRDHYRFSRLEPGTRIPVRLNNTIDVYRSDNRVFYGTVDQDVRGDYGRIVIPRGANVELMVRVARDNDLVLDLDSVVVNGQRYAIRTDPNRFESERDNSLLGNIVGAINGQQVRGPAVRVERGTVLTFRLERPLEMGARDREYYDREWWRERYRDQR